MNHPQPRHAECWLVVSDTEPSSAALFAFKQALQASGEPLAAWRRQHGLVQVLPRSALEAALSAALLGPAPRIHLYTDFDDGALRARVAAANQAAAPATGPAPARVRWRRWSADTVPDLLAKLARPDAPLELAWQFATGRQPNQAPLLQAAPGQAATLPSDHAAAFTAWAQSSQGEASALVAEELDEAIAEAETLLPPEAVEADQPEPQDAVQAASTPRPGLPVFAEGQVVAPQRQLPGALAAAPLRAAAAGSAAVLIRTWQAPLPGPGRPPTDRLFELCLMGDPAQAPTVLTLELRLYNASAWLPLGPLQVQLFSRWMKPLLVNMGDAAERGASGGVVDLPPARVPTYGRDITALLKALVLESAQVEIVDVSMAAR